MSNVTLPDGKVFGKDVRFSLTAGEVAGVDRQTDTHFETRPGSVVAFGNVVSVGAPTVTAHSTTNKTVWVRKEDGTELSITVPDTVQARAGQKVALLVASGVQNRKPKHEWCAIVNHTTRRWDQLDQIPPTDFGLMGADLGMFRFGTLWFGGWAFVCFLAYNSFISFSAGDIAVLVVIFFVSTFTLGSARMKAAKAAYSKAVTRAVEAAFAAGCPEPAQAPSEANRAG